MPRKKRKHRHIAFNVESNARRYRLRLARYVALAETIAEHVRATAGHRAGPLRLLDAGAGSGRTFQYLEPHNVIDDIEFHAIEYDIRRISHMYAVNRWHQVTQADLTKGVPYADEQFDIVVCEQVLEHLPQPQAVLCELVRVLRPEGLLIIGVPTFPPILVQIRQYLVPVLERFIKRRSGHSQVFTAGSLRKLVRQHPDMRIVAIRGFRIASGGVLATLENHAWWYRMNRRIGRLLPWLCVECQALAVKARLLLVGCLLACGSCRET